MIEAVENHTPQVLVIDEIGVVKECQAAREISRRGVQLIATAHGKTLTDVVEDPVLSNLVGGTQAVILGDHLVSTRKRPAHQDLRPKKTVMERKGKPSFDVIVEMTNRNGWIVYHDVAHAVDTILDGDYAPCEQRIVRGDKEIKKMKCDGDPDNMMKNILLPTTIQQVTKDPINVYGYTGEGDMYPSMVVNILNATSHEEVLGVDATYSHSDLQFNLDRASVRLHRRSSSSKYAQAARLRLRAAFNFLTTKLKEKEQDEQLQNAP